MVYGADIKFKTQSHYLHISLHQSAKGWLTRLFSIKPSSHRLAYTLSVLLTAITLKLPETKNWLLNEELNMP